MEHKTFKTVATKVIDSTKGIVKAFFAVFGNVDLGGDRIWPGSFPRVADPEDHHPPIEYLSFQHS